MVDQIFKVLVEGKRMVGKDVEGSVKKGFIVLIGGFAGADDVCEFFFDQDHRPFLHVMESDFFVCLEILDEVTEEVR